MNETHFKKLRELGDPGNRYLGNNSLKWANYVLGPDRLREPEALDRRFQRYDLMEYCRDSSNDHLSVLAAILSWGGMRRDHGLLLMERYKELEPIVEKLRSGHIRTRQQAFEALKQRRLAGKLPGLGTGYFTKLICFLAHDLNGYIMDQWVGKSVNLLAGRPVVRFTGNWVNDENSSQDYESFCVFIDLLGERLGCSGFDAERWLFSHGGHHPGAWRTYLRANYRLDR